MNGLMRLRAPIQIVLLQFHLYALSMKLCSSINNPSDLASLSLLIDVTRECKTGTHNVPCLLYTTITEKTRTIAKF